MITRLLIKFLAQTEALFIQTHKESQMHAENFVTTFGTITKAEENWLSRRSLVRNIHSRAANQSHPGGNDTPNSSPTLGKANFVLLTPR